MGIFSSIQKFRNKQIEKRERIRRVERALESTKKKKVTTSIERKAKALAKSSGATFEDALEYTKSQEKQKARKESMSKIIDSARAWGQQTNTFTASKGMGFKPKKISTDFWK